MKKDVRIFLFFILSVLLLVGCSRISRKVPDEVQKTVRQIRQKYAPDKRLTVFSVHLTKKGDQLIVSGEVGNKKLARILKDSILAHAERLDVLFDLKTLPDSTLGDSVLAIVDVSTGHLRRQPKNSAELVSQAILGSTLRLLKKKGGWFYVQMEDRYLGWMGKSYFWRTDSAGWKKWQTLPKILVTQTWGWVKKSPNAEAENLTDVVAGARLPVTGRRGNWYRVQLPGGKTGYLLCSEAIPLKKWQQEKPSAARIVQTARRFLGLPYLWGGTSSKAFDCSGFVQTVFKLNHIALPRDANQMAQVGRKIDPGENFQNLRPADLLFFGPRPGKITHVALSIGNGHFYHADGQVHENSLVQGDSLFNAYRFRTFRMARRILGR